MQSKYLVPASLLVIGSLGGALTAIAFGQETTEAAMAIPKPTPMHEKLAECTGDWTAECKVFMPGAEAPEMSVGTEHVEMMGELWQLSHFEGEMMGQAFEGRSIIGYDPDKEKFVGVWTDTMMPYMIQMEGTYDPATKTITMEVDAKDPMTGQPQKQKHTTRFPDKNTRVFEMFMPNPTGGGEMFKMMEITYKRK